MKDYFVQLFNYDKFANELIYKGILETNEPEKPVQLMAHLLAAQQIWLRRCQHQPAIGGALWPDWKADSFAAIITTNHQDWLSFLNGLNSNDFESIIHYQNSKGQIFENKLSDVLAHVINHGTHHRAQAGQWLKLAGLEHLPSTDYIFYIRDLKS